MTVDEQLTNIVRELFNNDGIVLRDDMPWNEIPEWDSLAQVNFVFATEQALGVQFSDDELARAKTIGDLKRILGSKQQADSERSVHARG